MIEEEDFDEEEIIYFEQSDMMLLEAMDVHYDFSERN